MPSKTRSNKKLYTSTPTSSSDRLRAQQVAPENNTQDEEFLARGASQPTQTQFLDLQTPSSQRPSEMDQLSVLNQTIEGTTERMEALAIQPMETTSQNSDPFPYEGEVKQLKGLLTIIAKASHHKTFMEMCLSKGEAPRTMVPQIKPHIYHTNQKTERLWRQTLTQASLNLVSILINHHTTTIRETTATLRKLEQEMKEKLEEHPSHIESWKAKTQEALETVNKLSEDLKKTRESKLNPNRKRRSQESGLDDPPSSKRQPQQKDMEELLRQVLLQSKNEQRPPRGAWRGRNRGRGRGGRRI